MTNQRSLNWKFFLVSCCLTGLIGACSPTSRQTKQPTQELQTDTSTDTSNVIGGENVDPTSYFHQKVLFLATAVNYRVDSQGGVQVNWTGKCTASAISPTVILTAAHCVIGLQPHQLYITLTPRPGLSPLKPSDWFGGTKVLVHEKYTGNQTNILYDLALIQLERPLPASRVLELAEPSQVKQGMELITIGYGLTTPLNDENEKNKDDSSLHFVRRKLEPFQFEDLVFSIDQSDHRGICGGDSGGPGLIYDPVQQAYFTLGVVSYTSIIPSEDQQIDPENNYGFCIGRGTYGNLLNSEIRQWILNFKYGW